VAYENRSSANYDSLQISVEKRLSAGLVMKNAYTWSHNIDDSTGVFNGLGDGRGTNGGPANPLNFRGDRGNSALDKRHLFSSNLVYDLPFGKGKRFANTASGPVEQIIGGWQFNGIFSAGSGQPYTVVTNGNNGSTRANVICADPKSGAPAGSYLNKNCFSDPAPVTMACPGGGTTITGAAGPATLVRKLDGIVDCLANVGSPILLGNSRRNQFFGPAYYSNDLSVFKNWSFRERYRVQFGMEFFNTFNMVNHVVPNNNFDNGDFGVFDNAFPSRQIQYHLKIFF